MSAVSVLLSEDHFCCSICRGLFNDPVTIPCGHNFCKPCITEHWENNVLCQCPNCSKVFNTIPELQANVCISEMTMSAQQKAREDICSVTNWKVIISCLVCLICILLWMVLQVKMQHCVPLEGEYVEYVENKAQLWKKEAEIQQLIQKRQLKIQEIKHSVKLSQEGADREIADGVQVFTALKESVERSQVELINTVKEKQRKTEEQAEGFIKELEQEISELKKRSSEVEQLSRSEDHLHLLQSFTSLSAAPPTKDWTGVSVHPPSYEGAVVKVVTQLEETLSGQVDNLLVAELKRVQQFAVDVTFDPETAHPELILSDDEKQVNCSNAKKNVPYNPERFDTCVNVLAKQSFSSGRFYYEVQVKGKTDWDLGVVRESINRKGEIILTPKNGYWTMWLRNDNEYKALADPDISLNLMWHPEKVGVFVDYEEGLVSFYDADAAILIYSFTGCSFTEKLYPYFSPGLIHGGKNSAPLIISPVNHTQ